MSMQDRIFNFVTKANWILLLGSSLLSLALLPFNFTFGIITGGLLVTINFHLLSNTLKKALSPKRLSSTKVVLIKYYIRFLVSGIIIFFLLKGQFVSPVGLILGLSVVVVSIMIATMLELTKYFLKEAV